MKNKVLEPCRRLLICSLGNPAPTYLNTRHSAGHFILSRLPPHLHDAPTTLTTDRSYRGPTASHHTYTLFQSPTLMNISGPAVRHAWKTFQAELSPDERPLSLLVLLHDELEKEAGKVKLKMGGSSGGQNGIQSCMEALARMEFVRIGVGISRPASRDPRAVAEYVLGKMTRREMEVMEEESLPKVVKLLQRLATEAKIPTSTTL